jgi:hypothetical protein
MIIAEKLIQIAENTPKVYEAGKTKGKEDGYEQGRSEGLAEGYNNGYPDGKADGYAEGYEKGKAEGSGDDSLLQSLIDRSITEIDIPEGVKQIGAYSLNYCGKLKRVTFPETLTYVGVSSVSNCPLLERVELPLGCNAVRSYAFSADTGLKSVVLGDTVEVQAGAFSGCTSCILYDFTRCTSVSTLANTNAFQAINAEAAILVPATLYDEWIVATNWAEYADYIVPLITFSIDGVEYTA